MNGVGHQVDKKLKEMIETFLMVDAILRERFGYFNMKDILLQKPMKASTLELSFPMDFKYEK